MEMYLEPKYHEVVQYKSKLTTLTEDCWDPTDMMEAVAVHRVRDHLRSIETDR